MLANPSVAAATTPTKFLKKRKKRIILSCFNCLLQNFDGIFETADEEIITEFQTF